MTLTTHVAIGAGIGVLVGNPVLGFTLGVISHFLVDMIPHGDTILADRFFIEKERMIPVIYTMVDLIVSGILVAVLAIIKPDSIAAIPFGAAIFGSALPDLLVGVGELWKNNNLFKSYLRLHFFFHDYFSRPYGDVNLKYALVVQGIFIVVVVKLIERIA